MIPRQWGQEAREEEPVGGVAGEAETGAEEEETGELWGHSEEEDEE